MTMALPLVSIVIPAYNADPFLERTLRSARAQTYRRLEILIVNDGSTDHTLALAEAAARDDDRVRVLSIPNGGVASARNLGTAEARGEYVAFLDADDLWHPTKIDAQVRAVTTSIRGRLPVASYALMRLIDREDRVTGEGFPVALSGYVLARHICLKPVGNGSSVLVRREIALEIGYDPTWVARGMGGCEDLDFELKLAAKHLIAGVPLFLVGYRQYPGNMSSQHLRMARGAEAVIEQHLQANLELPNWVAHAARASILGYVFGLLEAGRYWGRAGRVAARLMRLEPTLAAGIVYRKSRNRLVGKLGWHRSQPGESLRSFQDYDPRSGVESSLVRRRDQAFLQRLAEVDDRLAKHLVKRDSL